MKLKKNHDSLKNSCAIINKLFNKPNFFESLCNYSNNNLDTVITNISKIINYYLVTEDPKITYSISELLIKANSVTIQKENVLFYSTNSYYQKSIQLTGLNFIIDLKQIHHENLSILNNELSFGPIPINTYYIPFKKDIKESIISSFKCPEIIYQGIFKQPKSKELPFITGASEKSYYSSILEIRLKNASDMMKKTCATIGHKIIKEVIGKDSLLVLFPKRTSKYIITPTELEKEETGIHIPPAYISFIKIPSKYKLISICAQNLQYQKGKPLDVNTGAPYQVFYKEQLPENLLTYSRYELVSVTNNFTYSNTEFTQDINYDIDLIYGSLDSNKSRQRVSPNPNENIKFIKNRVDIIVRKIGNEYEIRNGRHRILYLKYLYVKNYNSYLETNDLEKLKKMVTIPMNVERSIENPIINEYIIKLSYLFRKINFFKNNINNEENEFILLLNQNAYIIRSESDIIELYNLLINNNIFNKYYIGSDELSQKYDYQKIQDYLVLTLREKIYNMSFLEIITYIKNNGFYIDNIFYGISNINFCALYSIYLDIQHNIQICTILGKEISVIKKAELREKMEEVGNIIMEILYKNPAYIKLDWYEFVKIISKHPKLKNYNNDFLEKAANHSGYQKLKFISVFSDDEYTKELKL